VKGKNLVAKRKRKAESRLSVQMGEVTRLRDEDGAETRLQEGTRTGYRSEGGTSKQRVASERSTRRRHKGPNR